MKHSNGNLLATGRRYIARKLARVERSTGGIIIPETAHKDRVQIQVEIVELGTHVPTPGDPATNYTCAVGDRVIISPHAGAKLLIDDEEYSVIGEMDIVAVIKPLQKEVNVNRTNKAVLA